MIRKLTRRERMDTDVMASRNDAGERPALPIVPRILDDLEVSVVELECSLLDTLTPTQFERVQELVQVSQLLTTARCVLGEQERRELERRELDRQPAANCGWRGRHRARRRERLVTLTAMAPSEARRGCVGATGSPAAPGPRGAAERQRTTTGWATTAL